MKCKIILITAIFHILLLLFIVAYLSSLLRSYSHSMHLVIKILVLLERIINQRGSSQRPALNCYLEKIQMVHIFWLVILLEGLLL